MSFRLPAPDGFSLAAASGFADAFPGTTTSAPVQPGLRFAWALDGSWRVVAVTLSQHGSGGHTEIRGVVETGTGRDASATLTEAVRRDVERILCLDVDATGWAGLGAQDPVVGRLQARFPGLRPVLFCTPYEAAAWCILGHRIQMAQTARIKQRLTDEHGERGAFPAPSALLALPDPQPGLTGRKVDQLHALAQAALDGALDRDRLRSQGFAEAARELQQLPGIGPFSAELVLIRGMGAPDALPVHETRWQRTARAAYGLPDEAGLDQVSEAWRPYRSWVVLLVRASA